MKPSDEYIGIHYKCEVLKAFLIHHKTIKKNADRYEHQSPNDFYINRHSKQNLENEQAGKYLLYTW